MRKLLKKNRKGFTLIELMIVVAIIGILAAIAIPNFIRYQLRSKTAEARTNIGGIKTNQESFRTSEDAYAPVAAQGNGASTVKLAWANTACPAGCNRTNIAGCTQFNCIGFEPAGDVYYQYDSPARAPGAGTTAEYAVGAIADLDGDTNTGQFAYQSSNDPTAPTGVIASTIATLCAAGQPPSEVVDCAPGVY